MTGGRRWYVISLASQAIQGELRNSEAKGISLERKMSQLSARVNRSGSSSVASSERSSRGESETRGGGIGEIGGRSTDVVEAEMASLRRQLNAANQVGVALEDLCWRPRIPVKSSGRQSDMRSKLVNTCLLHVGATLCPPRSLDT